MAKYKFYVGADFAAGAHFEEIVELPDDLAEKELQKGFEELGFWPTGRLLQTSEGITCLNKNRGRKEKPIVRSSKC